MEKKTLALVSYSNTIPFDHGIRHSDYFNKNWIIEKYWPSRCFEMFREHRVDLGLLPIASALFLEKPHHILGKYGIACEGEVSTVGVLSNVPLHDLEVIYLDYQSRTSVLLVQVLAKFYWKLKVRFKPGNEGFEQLNDPKSGKLLIGDRVFKEKPNYTFYYDLGAEWYNYTGLPFVFAAWFSWYRDAELEYELDQASMQGLKAVPAIIGNNPKLLHYLQNNILYELKDKMKEGLKLYLKLAQSLIP